MPNVIELSSMEDARNYSQSHSGPHLVLARETLDQIMAAEAAGGFEGGMSGASGQGGYSAPGHVPNSSSASDVPVELLDMHGSVPVGGFFENLVEKFFDIKDVWGAFNGDPLGPILLVPKRELERWLGTGPHDDA